MDDLTEAAKREMEEKEKLEEAEHIMACCTFHELKFREHEARIFLLEQEVRILQGITRSMGENSQKTDGEFI